MFKKYKRASRPPTPFAIDYFLLLATLNFLDDPLWFEISKLLYIFPLDHWHGLGINAVLISFLGVHVYGKLELVITWTSYD